VPEFIPSIPGTDRSVSPPLQRVLRLLILTEIALFVVSALALFLQDRFLPPLLQQYQDSKSEFRATDWVWVVLGIPALILSIIAWIALWRRWRMGRRLYTIAWLLFIPSIASSGPVVSTGAVDCLNALLSAVGGAVLSLLYFSDLRLLYVNRSA